MSDSLVPLIGQIIEIKNQTPDVKTFRVVGRDGKKLFEHKAGQCAMLSVPGLGESMISITSSPTEKDFLEFSIKKCGCVTEWIHQAEVGQEIGIRGPLGNSFPVDTTFKEKDILVIAGGIGLAPVRAVINYIRANRNDYGKLQIVYGSRSKQDLVYLDEIQNEWMKTPNTEVCLTIDKEQTDWDGHVGFVPNYVKELNPDPSMTVIMCGPPVMIHFTLSGLKELGFKNENVFTTMELCMKFGIVNCGRCNIGDKFVCKDGPVFSFDQLGELPPEY